MTTLHTPDTAAEAVLLTELVGLTQQAIADLDEDSLQSLRQALTSVSDLLLSTCGDWAHGPCLLLCTETTTATKLLC